MANILKTAKDQLLEKPRVDNEEDKTIRETASEEAMRMMFEPDDIEMRTDLSPPMILAMSRGGIYVDRFKSEVMKDFIHNIQVLSVSKQRKGRGELVALVRNSQDVYDEGVDMSAFAKVMGKG